MSMHSCSCPSYIVGVKVLLNELLRARTVTCRGWEGQSLPSWPAYWVSSCPFLPFHSSSRPHHKRSQTLPQCKKSLREFCSFQKTSVPLAGEEGWCPSCKVHQYLWTSSVYYWGEHPGIWSPPHFQCLVPGFLPAWGGVLFCGIRSPAHSSCQHWCKGGSVHTSIQSRWWPLYIPACSPSDTRPTIAVTSENFWICQLSELSLKSAVQGEEEGGQIQPPVGPPYYRLPPQTHSLWASLTDVCWWGSRWSRQPMDGPLLLSPASPVSSEGWTVLKALEKKKTWVLRCSRCSQREKQVDDSVIHPNVRPVGKP